MGHDILLALWFFAPAGLANASPIFVAKLPLLRNLHARLDFGGQFRHKPIFGANKTWRGLFTGIGVAIITVWVQQRMAAHSSAVGSLTAALHYETLPVVLLGSLFGLGALLGDAVESFFKRQMNIPPGHSWFPFDQLDYIIGGALATIFIVRLSVWQYIWVLIVWLVMHVIASFVGYHVGLKERPI